MKTIQEYEKVVAGIKELCPAYSAYMAETILLQVLEATAHPIIDAAFKARVKSWTAGLELDSFMQHYLGNELKLKLNTPELYSAWADKNAAEAALKTAIKEFQNEA